jgi:hypothetical protein
LPADWQAPCSLLSDSHKTETDKATATRATTDKATTDKVTTGKATTDDASRVLLVAALYRGVALLGKRALATRSVVPMAR